MLEKIKSTIINFLSISFFLFFLILLLPLLIYNNPNFYFFLEKTKMFIVNSLLIIIFTIFSIYIFLLIVVNSDPNFPINNKFNKNDEKIVNKSLDANGKDILIILDDFNYKNIYEHDDHGNNVSNKFKIYFKSYILPQRKEMDIKLINLSFHQDNFDGIKNLQLLDDKYKLILSNSYSLELYLKKIRKLNPNSKLIISLSFLSFYINNQIVELSNKYNFKISQAYLNSTALTDKYIDVISATNLNVTTWVDNIKPFLVFNFFLNTKNTIFIIDKDLKPINNVKYFDIYDFHHDRILEKKYYYPTSYLTPILAYEYYLNPNSNFIHK